MEEKFNTLILIGNGFDVTDGFKTKYSDFIESDIFRNLLGSNTLCQKIKSVKEHKNWVDLETELYNYSLELTKEYGIEGEVAEAKAKRFKIEYKKLRAALQEYINKTIESETVPLFDKIIEEYWLVEGANTHIVSFNYTSSVWVKFTKLIPNENIMRVHGSATYNLANKDNKIVLGIDESMKVSELHSFLYKSYDSNINNKGFKEWVNKANRYIIYGCSLGKTDEWYFKQIFKQKDKLFEVYYYGDEEINIKNRIHKLSGSLSDFKECNTLKMYDSSNKESEKKQRENENNKFYRI